MDEIHTLGEAIAASHYVTGVAHPWLLTSKASPSIGPTLARTGRVLGRCINDVVSSSRAGPLFRPTRPHFLLPGFRQDRMYVV